MVEGSCLCGAIAFTISQDLQIIEHCHCSMCRKSHGAAFATDAFVLREHFRWTRGEGSVARYESSPGTFRCFCPTCGSRLAMEPGELSHAIVVYVGALDTDPGGRPGAHIFVEDRPSWSEIHDALPRFVRGLDGPRAPEPHGE